MPVSNVDSASARELDQLMKEFPDWTHQFPELDRELNPIRYSKNKLYLKDQNTDFLPRQPTTKFPKSDYRNAYRQHNTRPRSSKRPPKTPPRHTGLPRMTFDTVQRDEFIPRKLDERTKPIIMKENYERPNDVLDLTTKYAEDYTKKELPKGTHQALPHLVPRSTIRPSPSGTFDNRTITMQDYRKWPPQKTFTFGELPSFTGSILYPGQHLATETTTGTTYRGAPGRRTKPFIPEQGSIAIEGEMQMDTTHNDVFVPFNGAQPAKKIITESKLGRKKRCKFRADTQSKHDFPGYANGQPKPPKPATPAPDSCDIKFHNLQSFETEQRKQFMGIDTVQYPMRKSTKKETDEYTVPATKFETKTSQKLDYQPIDLKAAYRAPVPVNVRRSTEPLPKFEALTTSKEFYRRWDVPQRKRYRDFHEANSYVPPAQKFDAVTTNQEMFYRKNAVMRSNMKPDDQRISREGEQRFSTVYDETFQGFSAAKRLSKEQALLLLKALRQRKCELEQGARGGAKVGPTPQLIAAK